MKTAKELTAQYQSEWDKRISSARNMTKDEFFKEVNAESGESGGVKIPEAFITPDEVIDEIMPNLNGAEFKVLMYIVRKTFGYRKYEGDKIPLSQIVSGTKRKDGSYYDKGTGLSKTAVLEALKFLEKSRIILVKRTKSEDGLRQINYYVLNTRNDYTKKRVE